MSKKGKIINIISKVLMIILYIISIIIGIYINKLNILDFKYLIISYTALFIMNILITLLVLGAKSTKQRIMTIILNIIILPLIIILTFYLNSTINFIESTSSDYEYREYLVLVTSNKYSKIKNLKNKKIAFIDIDLYLEDSINYLKKNISINDQKYNDISKMTTDLNNNILDAIVLESSYISLLEENYNDFYKSTKTIYKYKLKIKKEYNSNNVETNSKPFIFYISGIDTYGDISKISRSDVNMVVVINPKTYKILLVNIPRDFYVQLHGTTGTKDKLTHAGMYGIDMSVNTIEDFLNIDINYYLRINFTSLINIIDIIDGVDVYSDKTFTTSNKPYCHMVEGINHLNGECALAYSRERYAYSSGDYHRGSNQQEVIKGVINKLNNKIILMKYGNILNAINGSIETNMSYYEITSLIKHQLTNEIKWDVQTVNLGGTGGYNVTYSMGSTRLYVTEPNYKQVEETTNLINKYLIE